MDPVPTRRFQAPDSSDCLWASPPCPVMGRHCFTGGKTKTPRGELIHPRPQSCYVGSGPQHARPTQSPCPARAQHLGRTCLRGSQGQTALPWAPGPRRHPTSVSGTPRAFAEKQDLSTTSWASSKASGHRGQAVLRVTRWGESPALRPRRALPGTRRLPLPQRCPWGPGQEASVTARGHRLLPPPNRGPLSTASKKPPPGRRKPGEPPTAHAGPGSPSDLEDGSPPPSNSSWEET